MGAVTERLLRGHLYELSHLLDWLGRQEAALIEFKCAYLRCLERGGKLLFVGNGGSAADAQHVAAEYVVRFGMDRRALPALALTVDTSVLTAAGNDLSFGQVFRRQVEALGSEKDLLVVHSTSGESPNLMQAVLAAHQKSMPVAALLGKGGGALSRMGLEHEIIVPSTTTSHIQELHMVIQHMLVELVERELMLCRE